MEERLQKLIAAAGVASRRHAEELIAAGEVTVNGRVVRELGTKADPERDHIKVRGRLINPKLASGGGRVYVLLNKPRGYLSSVSDPEGRPLVVDLVPHTLGRLHPVGRLDFNTEGLLILTNDGELTNAVTSARNRVAKVYEAKVKGVPTEEAIARLRRGIRLDDGVRTAPAVIEKTGETETNSWFEVTLHEGRNQQIRRMFDAVGHSVLKLRRVRIGHLRDDRMRVGEFRMLTPREVEQFKSAGRRKSGATKKKNETEKTVTRGEAAGKGRRKGSGGARRTPGRDATRKGG